jgi:hypothetical protein
MSVAYVKIICTISFPKKNPKQDDGFLQTFVRMSDSSLAIDVFL